MVKRLPHRLLRLPRETAILAVRGYQMTLSPDHGPLKGLHPLGFCRHEPTCSAYAIEALRERGLLLGTLLALRRVLGCHPWKRPDARRIMRASHGG